MKVTRALKSAPDRGIVFDAPLCWSCASNGGFHRRSSRHDLAGIEVRPAEQEKSLAWLRIQRY